MLQFAPGASVPPGSEQVTLPHEKSGLLDPTMSTPVKVIVPGPLLATVTVSLDEHCPSVTVPKFTDVGVNPIEIPVPVSAAVCGLVGSLSATLNVPVV